ncbi:hypothetical protein OH77DRAFT_267588 [Trametes cingulata]|nr:hypothetical protein OH77DRAFT_267588 [Trametes cingulata]
MLICGLGCRLTPSYGPFSRNLPHERRAALFARLECSNLHDYFQRDDNPFLRMVSSPFLECLSRRTRMWLFPVPGPYAGILRDDIAEHPSGSSVEELKITIGPRCSLFQRRLELYFPEHLAPLLQMSALRILHISGECFIMTDDNYLHDVTRAWPDIQVLGLCWPFPQ